MGGGPAPQQTGTTFQPGQLDALNQGFNTVQQQGAQSTDQINGLISSMQSNPQLATQFAQFFNPQTNGYTSNFNNMGGLDNTGQAQVSQQQAQTQGAAAAQARANQSQLGTGNQGLASVLNRQLGAQALLGGQTAYANAASGQQTRALNTNSALTNAASAQAQLQQAGNNAQLDQNDAANANTALKANLATNAAQNSQATLASLFGTAQGTGTQYANSPSSTTSVGHVGITTPAPTK